MPDPLTRRPPDRDPQGAAHHVVEHESRVGHAPDPGPERREGANDGYEPRENNGLAAVFLVERMRAIEMFLVEKTDFCSLKYPWSYTVIDPVIQRVADDGRRGEHDEEHSDVH